MYYIAVAEQTVHGFGRTRREAREAAAARMLCTLAEVEDLEINQGVLETHPCTDDAFAALQSGSTVYLVDGVFTTLKGGR